MPGNQRIGFSPEGIGNIENVSPGEYRLTVSMPVQDYFIKEARFERMDVLNDPWQISNRTSGTLTIMLSPKVGLIEGNLTDALSKPVGGNLVVLIPDLGRDRTELFRSATTDANGHFSIRGAIRAATDFTPGKRSNRTPTSIATCCVNTNRRANPSGFRKDQRKTST